METKLLLVLRAGRGSLHRAWTGVCSGAADVAISLYDDTTVNASEFVLVHRHPGGKYLGVQAMFGDNPWLLEAYTHFCLLDDDLYLPFASLAAMKDCIEHYRFALCAPSLAPESFASWPITIQNSAFHLRATNFVEVMAPIMSREFLKRALPLFSENHSSWGFEWLWMGILEEMNRFAAILDCAPIVHTRQVGTGNLYNDPTGERPGPFDEMRALLARYGIEQSQRPQRNYFGLARTDLRLLCGDEFLGEALEGYPFLLRHNRRIHEQCRVTLFNLPRPLDSVEDVLAFKGAAALLMAVR